MGQPGSSNRLGTSSSEVPDLLVHSEVDSGPGGVPAPKWSPTLWSDSIIPGMVEVAAPLLSNLRSAPLPARRRGVREPKQTLSFGKLVNSPIPKDQCCTCGKDPLHRPREFRTMNIYKFVYIQGRSGCPGGGLQPHSGSIWLPWGSGLQPP